MKHFFQRMYAFQQPNVSQCAVFSGRVSLFIVSQTQNTDDGRDEVMRPGDHVMVSDQGLGASVSIDTSGQVSPGQ